MSRVVVINHVTLDGVMQAPGRPEEDTRDGFTHGGWASPNVDDVVMTALGTRMGEGMRLLLGRRSYESILGYWNTQDSPFTPRSTTPTSTSPRARSASRCAGPTRRCCAAICPRRWCS
jgi:dihydrofolate reductase